jgi:hypothetical protein
MLHLNPRDIPDKHVVNRWTKNATDVLRENLCVVGVKQQHEVLQTLPGMLEKDDTELVDHEVAEAGMETEENLVQENGGECMSDSLDNSSREKHEMRQADNKPLQASLQTAKKRSRFCTVCRVEGHKSTPCLLRGDFPKLPRS